MPIVLYPFIQITAHVVYAPGIRLLGSHRVGHAVAVVVIPCNAVRNIIAAIFLLHSCAAGIFPFGFTGKAILFAGLGVEFLDEFFGIIPAHILYRAIVTTVVKFTWIVAHDGTPLTLRYLSNAYSKFSEGYMIPRLQDILH